MADQVTHGADKTPDQIELEMAQTRESLTEKVSALESQVVGTVQTAADTISGTVEAVKSLVSSAPETVSETVRQASSAISDAFKGSFDISARVRENPLPAVGIAALVGGIVGFLTASRRPSFKSLASASPAASTAAAPAYAAAPREPGIMDDLMGMVGAKVKELARTAFDSVSASVKSNIETSVPKLVDDAASRLTDGTNGPDTLASRFDARRV